MARDYWFAFGSQPSLTASLAPTFITFVNGSGQTIAPPAITETFAGSGLYRVNYTATQTISFIMDGATTGLDSSIRYIFGVFDPQDNLAQTFAAANSSLVALGMSSVALGTTSVAIGLSNIALGTTNVALGTSNIALGMTNVALGTSNLAQGNTSIALGTTAVAIGLTLTGLETSTGTTLVAIGNTLSGFNLNISGIGDTSSTFGDVNADPVTVFGYLKRVVEFLEGNSTFTKATGGLTFSSRGSSYVLANKTVSDTTTETTKS